MAASIRSWVKDRLTRYEAKNKVDLPLSPGAEVQVEKVRVRSTAVRCPPLTSPSTARPPLASTTHSG